MHTLLPSPLRWTVGILNLLLVFYCPAHAQTFANPPLYPTTVDPGSLAVADVNHDGKPDLIYLDATGSAPSALHIALGRGNGTFAHGQDMALPAGICCSLTIADVTNDGNPDILLSGTVPTPLGGVNIVVAVLVGNGDGTFQEPIVNTFDASTLGADPLFRSPFAVGDLNGDGKMDLALVDRQNSGTHIFLGDGTGNFTAGTPVTSGRDNAYLVDLNGDEKLDLVTTDSFAGLFDVYLGKGDGTFVLPAAQYAPGVSAGYFFLVDVNRDGHLDMFLEYYPGGTPSMGYYPGMSDGTFGSLISLGPPPTSSGVAAYTDLNGDGIPDLAFLTPSGVGVSLGGPNQTLGPLLTTISGGSTNVYSILPATLGIGDFNADGKTDLAVPVEGGISVLLGNGDGTFQSVPFYDLGHEVGAAAVADFSGHQFQDIAVSLPATFPRLLLGNGTGTFTLGPDPHPSYGLPGADVTLLSADFNGDGKPDLSIGNMVPNTSAASNVQSVLLNMGNGVFASPVAVPNSSPIMADFNLDGRTDIINVLNGQITVSLGQADGTFTVMNTALRLPFDTGHFNVGDVNRDGKPDLVLNYYDHLEIWLGNGDGTFTYNNSIGISTVENDSVTIGDVDGDGNGDIILSPDPNPGRLGPLVIFYGNGDGTFQPPAELPTTRQFFQVVVADINRDGNPDLVVTDGAAIATFINLGGRQFAPEVDYIAGRAVSALNVVDVNSDGFPDIVVANTGGTTVTVLLNQPNGTTSGTTVNGTLSVSPEPSTAGQSFSITLAVSAPTNGGPLPTGSVSFNVDGTFVGDAQLSSGSATYVDSTALIPGSHTIIATYNGDTNYSPRSFSTVHTVQPPTYATTTILSATPANLLASQTVRLLATVTSVQPLPLSEVTFLDGTNSIGAAELNSSGVAELDTALLAPGAHSLSANYAGSTRLGFSFNSSYPAAYFSPSTSAVVPVTVTANITSISLTASASSAVAGTVLTFSAQGSSTAGAPFGGVSFFDGTSLLGTQALTAGGAATFSTASLSVGSHTITATFNANGPYAASTSSPVTISVTSSPAGAAAVVIALSEQNASATGSGTLVASVSPFNLSSGATVTFLDSGTILGSAPLDASGTARLQLTQMGSGQHSLTASFGGDAQFASAVTPVLTEEWPPAGPGFSLQVEESASKPVSPAVAEMQVNVIPLAQPESSVSLSCVNGLPAGYACKFSALVLNGGGNSTLSIEPKATASRSPLQTGVARLAVVFVLTMMFGTYSRRRSALLLAVFVCLLVSVTGGCGNSARSADVSRTAVITIQAAASTGNQQIIHSAQVSVRLSIEK
jgi:Bacterial Ig-like domain (group 3)/FG-GAP-like repeat